MTTQRQIIMFLLFSLLQKATICIFALGPKSNLLKLISFGSILFINRLFTKHKLNNLTEILGPNLDALSLKVETTLNKC